MKVPAPAASEVLVKVSACGMNNTDVWLRQGAPIGVDRYQTAKPPTFVPEGNRTAVA